DLRGKLQHVFLEPGVRRIVGCLALRVYGAARGRRQAHAGLFHDLFAFLVAGRRLNAAAEQQGEHADQDEAESCLRVARAVALLMPCLRSSVQTVFEGCAPLPSQYSTRSFLNTNLFSSLFARFGL